jgi:hypothetical protein
VIKDFRHRYQEPVTGMISGHAIAMMQYKLSFLLEFQAKLDHLIGDFELFARRTIERSFLHLNRILIVDMNVRDRCRKEFESKGEIGVEKFGAIHLLSHGIWAFKIDAVGERTDLILGEPLKNIQDDVHRTAQVLALTEWKIIAEKKNINHVASDALRQAKLYASGSLLALELEKWRYLVLVSLERIPVSPDYEEAGITYRYINIAIDPLSPSKQKAWK